MTHFRTFLALGAVSAVLAVGLVSFAQDDLDDLLKDLESDAAAETAVVAPTAEEAAEPAAEDADAAAEDQSAEESPAVEAPTAEEPAVIEAAEPAVEDADVAVEEQPAEETAEPAAEDALAAEEPAAEETAEPVAEDADVAVEEPPAEDAPSAEAPAAEESAAENAPMAEEPAAEETAEPVAEEAAKPVAEAEKVDSVLNLLDELSAETPNDEPAAAAPETVAEETPAAVAAAPAPVPAKIEPVNPDAELLENIRKTEEVRRKAFDAQAKREIIEARRCMRDAEYTEAARHYGIASKLLNDSPASQKFRRECDSGIAEGLYRAAMLEDRTGRRERAVKLMEKAIDMRHPKARKQLEAWNNGLDPNATVVSYDDIKSRRNDAEYKDLRAKNRDHLKRARQLLSLRDIDNALVECELVLVNEPYNQEALRLRKAIQSKRNTILKQEHEVTREGMIADVEEAWRPVYAPNARTIEERTASTVKTGVGDDPERSVEQSIIKRMKDMRLPAISFKPPATIIDAVDFFRQASKDFDRPEVPLEQRGFNFVLKTPETLRTQTPVAGGEEDEGFTSEEEDAADSGMAGVPMIPMITASDISFYEALKLVCDSVDYKFKVRGKIVMVMPKNMTTEEMVIRNYPVMAAFLDKMGSASSDMKELKSNGFGASNRSSKDDGEENQERDWKEFFTMLGVQWPEGSSIFYMKTLGKLRVKNTYENLAELEKALTELNVDQKLIEIETRFVEVCQDDLNSLGFEWILNSDYSLDIGKHLSRALNLKNGKWGETSGSRGYSTSYDGSTTTIAGGITGSNGSTIPLSDAGTTVRNVTGNTETRSSTYTVVDGGNGGRWSKRLGGGNSGRTIGINAFGGDSDYTTANRYLSTMGNHIAGESSSINDSFMRVNAFIGNADLSMILHMLSQRSDTDLLSAPKVLTRPGEEAVIKVVTEYIYPTEYDVQLQSSSSSGSGNSSGSQSAILAVVEPENFTMREVGVILDVTPTLTDDGNLIDLELKTQVVDEPTWKNYGMKIPFTGNSSLQNFEGIGDIFSGIGDIFEQIGTTLSDELKAMFASTTLDAASSALDNLTRSQSDNMTYYDAPMEQPFFHVRSIESKVSVHPGATIVMGGLITEQRKAMDDKIPFLGDLPFIGRLFRSHAEQTSKRNLLIFVTTRLVDVRGREVTMGTSETQDASVKAAPDPEAE